MLVIGLFSWSMLLQGEVQDLQGRVQSLQSQPQDQSQAPQMIALEGVGTKQGARAELVTLEGDRAVLVPRHAPRCGDKTYQIWYKGDNTKPSGLSNQGARSGRGREAERGQTPGGTVEPRALAKTTTEPLGGQSQNLYQ